MRTTLEGGLDMGNFSAGITRGVLPHWGLSRDVFAKLRAVVPRSYFDRMRVYFELYGCLVCQSKKGPYFSCGMCRRCSVRVRDRLGRCVRVLAKRQSQNVEPISTGMATKIRSARSLLADLRVPRAIGSRRGVAACAAPRMIMLRLADEKSSVKRNCVK
jgi:hypothetical protein